MYYACYFILWSRSQGKIKYSCSKPKEQVEMITIMLLNVKFIIIYTYTPQSYKRRDGMEGKYIGNPRQLKQIAVPKYCKENNHVG